MRVNLPDAKNRLSQLIRAARAGEEVVIANRGEPVARLAPMAPEDKKATGDAQRILAWKKRNPLPPSLRRSMDEIDADLEAERNA